MTEVKLNLEGLERIVKALQKKQPQVRIGILGDKAARSDGTQTNAEIGIYHEFGTAHLPMRSFLRVPLTELLPSRLEAAGAFDDDVLDGVMTEGSLRPWLQKVAVLGEGIVVGAFHSQGYGRWPGWSDHEYMNHAGMVLVDTTQLKNSITSEVTE